MGLYEALIDWALNNKAQEKKTKLVLASLDARDHFENLKSPTNSVSKLDAHSQNELKNKLLNINSRLSHRITLY
jgi:hypothetical protein